MTLVDFLIRQRVFLKTIKKPSSLGNWAFLLFVCVISSAYGAVSVTTLIQRNQRLPIQSAATDELVGRYLIVNQDLNSFRVFVNFANSCNIRHFTRNDISLPIEKVQLKITDASSTTTETLYDRSVAGTDCLTTLTWEPAGPTYDETYVIEVLLDWNDGSSIANLAGTYSETVNLIAVEL